MPCGHFFRYFVPLEAGILWGMSTAETLQARIAALEEAIETVSAGRVAQWGDRMVTMVNLPDLELALARAERSLDIKVNGRKGHAVAKFEP